MTDEKECNDDFDLDNELKRQLLECQKEGFQLCIRVIREIDEQTPFNFKPLIKLLEEYKEKVYEDD